MSETSSAAAQSRSSISVLAKIPAGLIAFVVVLFGFGLSHMLLTLVYKAHLSYPFMHIFIVAGTALILVTRKMSPAWQAALGGLSGLLFWAAFGEILEAGDLFEVKSVWGVVLVTTIFLALRPGTRCDFFVLIQKRLGLHKELPEGVHWHAPAVSFEFFFTVWVAHMFELTAYYDPAFGVYSWLTKAILVVTMVATPFLIYLLYRTRNWAQAWGRAIPIVLIAWMWVEILMKWEVINKPW